ncbi:60S ribosomal protein L35a-like [Hippocampus zosterae]|uniref:60S ribosomal protein L35a-like n=1 Tax=Hippocampus zosterae TaxID=109293 RepID=UPI00223D2F13|nr:60S ribosomal protein L35a-like [Hippocampus zosterae]
MTKEGEKKVKRVNKRAPVRLWAKGKFVGFRRSKVQQNTNQCLVRVAGLADRKDASYYFGKRLVYIYKATTKTHKEKHGYRTIWGRICRAHGNGGTVVARFNTNLPSRAIGSTLRIMMYPQRA